MTQAAALSSSLQETFSVVIEPSAIDHQVALILADKAKTVKMDGFRPGKVPQNMIRDRFLGQALKETIDYFIQSESKKVLVANKLNPAVRPTYELEEYTYGQPLTFKLNVEKMPEVELQPYNKLNIARISCPVSQEEIDEETATFLKDKVVYKAASKGTALADGHRVKATVSCSLGKKEISEQSFQEKYVIISDVQDAEFAELMRQFKQHTPGAEFEYIYAVPKNDKHSNNAGKTLTYKVKYIAHEVPSDATMTLDMYVKDHALESADVITNFIKERIENERTSQIATYHKRLVLDALSEQYNFPLPPTLVETEFQTIWNRLVDDNNHPENTDKVDLEDAAVKAELDAEYRNIAERRVMLGLVIAKIAEKENIRLTQEYIYRVLFQEAMRYPGQQQQVLKYFKDNPAAVETLVSPHIEHFVIEFLLNTLDTAAKDVTKSEMHGLFAGVLPGFEGDDAEPKAEKAKKAAPKAKKKAADAE